MRAGDGGEEGQEAVSFEVTRITRNYFSKLRNNVK